MKRILIVEDDHSLGKSLSERLAKDYHIFWTKNVTETQVYLKNTPPIDLVILDVGLPDGSGFDLARKIKDLYSLPFLFLTAQSDAESRLEGFELGAEEFIPKPFHLKELLLRIEHVLDKHRPQSTINFDDLIIDFQKMSIRLSQQEIMLSNSEIRTLFLLIQKSPQAISRNEIMDAVWGEDKNLSPRTIDNLIVKIRDHLGPRHGKKIRSVRGLGYQWLNEETE